MVREKRKLTIIFKLLGCIGWTKSHRPVLSSSGLKTPTCHSYAGNVYLWEWEMPICAVENVYKLISRIGSAYLWGWECLSLMLEMPITGEGNAPLEVEMSITTVGSANMSHLCHCKCLPLGLKLPILESDMLISGAENACQKCVKCPSPDMEMPISIP